MHPLITLARDTADHLAAAPAKGIDMAVRAGFVADLRAVPDNLPVADAGCPGVRGLRHAASAFMSRPSPLAKAARSAFGHVRWTELHAEDDWSRPVLADFANGEGIGPDGRLRCNDLIPRLFVMGPGTTYPPHAHPAEEFHIPFGARAEPRVGVKATFRPARDREVVWHAADVPHSIRTGNGPLVAIFGWRGDISTPNWYADDMTDVAEPRRYPTSAKA